MKRYRLEPGKPVDLSHFDPGSTAGFKGGKHKVEPVFEKLNARLEVLQERLWAEGKRSVLVVLQGIDTSGKDGTIRHVFDGVNPMGVRVASFKAPTEEERAQDFLWRVHAKMPAKGEMVIFNRSHYEDVLVVRVRNLAPKKVWKARYEQINHFEKLCADNGTTILKFFLHIDRDEQKERLEERLADPLKRWKFRLGDLEDRALWDEYMKAYEDALRKTTTSWAPWYVVPANHKWFRNLVVATALVDALDAMKIQDPVPTEDLEGVEVE